MSELLQFIIVAAFGAFCFGCVATSPPTSSHATAGATK
jgi:hypothetical protein